MARYFKVKIMSFKNYCETCAFCIKGETDPQTLKPTLFCHRFPPVPVVIPGPQTMALAAFHPSVMLTTVACGEYAANVFPEKKN